MTEKTDSIAEVCPPTSLSLRHFVLFLFCAALFFVSSFYRTSNAVIASRLLHDLSLSPETLGLLSASFFYSFAVTQIPLALLLDYLGARLILTALMLLGSLGACIYATSHSLSAAVVGQALLGCGMAGNLMGGLKLFTRWFSPREFATLSGLLVGSGTLGSLAACTPFALLVEAVGWRSSLFAIGILTALLAGLFYLVIRDAPVGSGAALGNVKTPDIAGRLKVLFMSRDYWLISCGTFFRYGTLMAIQGLWAGPYLMGYLELSPVAAGNILMFITIGYVAGCSLGGWLSDRVLSSRKYVVLIGLIGMAAMELALTGSVGRSETWLLIGVFSLLGIFGGFGNVMYAHIKGIMPLEMAGMALTGINLFTMLGVGAYIHAMGWVLDHLGAVRHAGPAGYRAAFFMAFAGTLVAALLYFFTRESEECRS